MNRPDIERLAEQLRNARESLLSQRALRSEGTAGRVQVAAAHFSHPEDSHAQLISQKDIEFATSEQNALALNAVEAALARIASGTYGQCIDCGRTITLARLEVSPEAARCMHCQAAFEQKLALN